MDDEMMTVTATGLVHHDGGSLTIFKGIEDATGDEIRFVVEHRFVNDLFWSVAGGEEPQVAVPEWAVVRRVYADR